MRTTIIMAVLCVALLTTATYAWFTLSNSARITNLSLQVGEASGLMIAPEVDTEGTKKPGEYSSELNLTALQTAAGKLMPATLAKADADSAYTVLKPTYTGEEITALTALEASDVMTDANASTAGDYYCYEKPFYLLSSGSKLNIALQGSAVDGADTWVKDDNAGGAVEYPASYAMRIAFFKAPLDGTEELIGVYEPNSDSKFTVERTDKVKADKIKYTNTLWSTGKDVGKDLAEKADGTFVKTSNNTSEGFIKLESGEDTRIIMRVYFAGEDNECCNIIALNKILGQLKLVTVADPVSP